MGIWIRSQNKHNLCECVNITISLTRRGNEYRIDGDPGSFEAFLGVYPSAEEAEKVLDMIQERIDMTMPESIMMQGKAFRMPPAGFLTWDKEPSRSERLSRERYLEFVSELEAEGDPDIPSEEQWRDELKAAIEAEEG